MRDVFVAVNILTLADFNDEVPPLSHQPGEPFRRQVALLLEVAFLTRNRAELAQQVQLLVSVK
jgi:hypothetical protein